MCCAPGDCSSGAQAADSSPGMGAIAHNHETRRRVIVNVDAVAVVLVAVALPVALMLLVQTEQSALSFCICPALGKKPLKSPINDLKYILITANEQRILMPQYLYDEAWDAIGVRSSAFMCVHAVCFSLAVLSLSRFCVALHV